MEMESFIEEKRKKLLKLHKEHKSNMDQVEYYKKIITKYEDKLCQIESKINSIENVIGQLTEFRYENPTLSFSEEAFDDQVGPNVIRFVFRNIVILAETNVYGRSKYFDELKIEYENIGLRCGDNTNNNMITKIQTIDDIYSLIYDDELEEKPWIRKLSYDKLLSYLKDIVDNLDDKLERRIGQNDKFLREYKEKITFEHTDLIYGDWDDDPTCCKKIEETLVVNYPISEEDLAENNITKQEVFSAAFKYIVENVVNI
jgi:hypothetical protein